MKPIDPKNFYQILNGKQVALFNLSNSNGMLCQITNYGGRIVSLFTEDKNGNFEDVVLGHESLDDYLNGPNDPYFGAIIGRYGNRIKNGTFELNGKSYQLAINNGPNHLHGGLKGFSNVVWDAEQISNNELELTYLSIDGEENYPGNLSVTVRYELTNDNSLKISYSATTDAPTLVNLTNHSYFNLKGAGNGSIRDHELSIAANHYIPTDENSIPTGEIATVEDTPMDFRVKKLIGEDIDVDFEQLKIAKGYDHTFVFNSSGPNELGAYVLEPKSGRTLELYTNEPGVQLYTGNWVTGCGLGKNDKTYLSQASFCLETQHYPNSPNQDKFPSTVLNPGETYESICIYKFGILTE